MRKLLIHISAAILAFSFAGCKELDKLSELEEWAEKMSVADASNPADSLDADSVIAQYIKNDSIIYDEINFNNDSLNHYVMQTAIKKVILEGHDYWTIVGVGENKGGVGITHSKSCRCKKTKKNNIR